MAALVVIAHDVELGDERVVIEQSVRAGHQEAGRAGGGRRRDCAHARRDRVCRPQRTQQRQSRERAGDRVLGCDPEAEREPRTRRAGDGRAHIEQAQERER
jgi:hypothetical protein